MNVTLLHATPLSLADLAIGKCWDKESRDVLHMIDRMDRVGNKYKHSSTLEHINYTWEIDGISRACLQELARHRHQSLSVKSTRYTLKELKDATNLSKFIVPITSAVNYHNIEQLKHVQTQLQQGTSNDVVKYMLPEAYKTSLVSTMNMRGFQNFLSLRTSKAALTEIRELAWNMLDAIPASHRFMFVDIIKERQNDRT